MKIRLAIIWVCNLIDTIATVYLCNHFDGEELNPISDWFLSQSTDMFVIFKMIVVTYAVIFMLWKQDMKFCKIASWILFVEYLLVAIYYMFIYSVLDYALYFCV